MANGTGRGREVFILIAGVALGAVAVAAAMGRPARSGGAIRSFSDLPRVEVVLTSSKKSLGSFVLAATPRDQADAWLGYLTDPRPTLLRWKEGGDYPVFDVPPGWSAVWLDADGKVLGSSDGNGARTNMVLPGQSVRQAMVLPKGEVPPAGSAVEVFERQAVKP